MRCIATPNPYKTLIGKAHLNFFECLNLFPALPADVSRATIISSGCKSLKVLTNYAESLVCLNVFLRPGTKHFLYSFLRKVATPRGNLVFVFPKRQYLSAFLSPYQSFSLLLAELSRFTLLVHLTS